MTYCYFLPPGKCFSISFVLQIIIVFMICDNWKRCNLNSQESRKYVFKWFWQFSDSFNNFRLLIIIFLPILIYFWFLFKEQSRLSISTAFMKRFLDEKVVISRFEWCWRWARLTIWNTSVPPLFSYIVYLSKTILVH